MATSAGTWCLNSLMSLKLTPPFGSGRSVAASARVEGCLGLRGHHLAALAAPTGQDLEGAPEDAHEVAGIVGAHLAEEVGDEALRLRAVPGDVLAAGLRERHLHAAAVLARGAALNEAALLERAQGVGDARVRDPRPSGELAGRDGAIGLEEHLHDGRQAADRGAHVVLGPEAGEPAAPRHELAREGVELVWLRGRGTGLSALRAGSLFPRFRTVRAGSAARARAAIHAGSSFA